MKALAHEVLNLTRFLRTSISLAIAQTPLLENSSVHRKSDAVVRRARTALIPWRFEQP